MKGGADLSTAYHPVVCFYHFWNNGQTLYIS